MRTLAFGGFSGLGLGVALALRPTLRVPVFGESWWLVTSLPQWYWLAFGATFGTALGALLARAGKLQLIAPFAFAGLAGAVLLPGAFSVAPFLATFSGRFLDFLLWVLLLAVAVRWLLARPLKLGRTALFLAGLTFYTVVGLKLARDVGLSGDEPHYLLVTYSLLHDGDLQVQNNYGDEDFRSFYQGRLGPHLAAGTPYSVHGAGLSVLLLPGFAVAGLTGVLLTEAILAAWLLVTVHAISFRLTEDGSASVAATLAFALSAPTLFLSVSAYPELPVALVVGLVFLRLTHEAPPRQAGALGWGLLVGVLPFFHVKFVPLAFVLWAALVARYRQRNVVMGALAAVFALAAFSYVTLGSVDPSASYGRQRVFASAVPHGVAGLLLDQEFGLLTYAPVYLLGFAGLGSLWTSHRFLSVLAWLTLAAVTLPGAAHPLWSGGTSPPARFLFPALPLVAAAVACLVASRKGIAAWAPSLLATGIGLSAAMLVLTPQPLYLNARDGSGNVFEALSSSWDLTGYLPSLVRADTTSLVWTGILVAFGIVSVVARRSRLGRISPALLALSAAFAQDLFAPSRSSALEPLWSSRVLNEIGAHLDDRFVALPEHERLQAADVMARVSLPLDPVASDGDPAHWWSRAYSLPAGSYEVDGVNAEGVGVANGEGMISRDEKRFETAVGLARFRLRAATFTAPPRLRLIAPHPSEWSALRSIALDGGARIHGLDDDAYLDPVGFWTKGSRVASFFVEPAETVETLKLVAGPVATWVRVSTPDGDARFRIAPSGEKSIRVPRGVVRIASEGAFRPSAFDGESHDQRELGVLLSVRPAFDLSR